MNEIDQTLDSLSPAELTTLEQGLDKEAADAKAAFHFQSGVKMAAEAFAAYKETGELSPLLALVTEPPQKVAVDADGVDAALDKCSTEQLATIEAELDSKASESKIAEEYAAKYFDMGVKMAQDWVGNLSGGDSTKTASCSRELLDKLAGIGGRGFTASKDLVLAARKATGGTSRAATPTTFDASGQLAKGRQAFVTGGDARSVIAPNSKTMRGMGIGGPTGLHRTNPIATGVAAGVGGTLVAQGLFGNRDNRR
jgi:hypothetical protein